MWLKTFLISFIACSMNSAGWIVFVTAESKKTHYLGLALLICSLIIFGGMFCGGI